MGQSCRYASCMSRGMRDNLPFALSRASGEQRFGLLEISGVKTLGEPAVERHQQVLGFLALVLLLPQPTQTQHRPQFPGCREQREAMTRPKLHKHRPFYRKVEVKNDEQCRRVENIVSGGWNRFRLICYNRDDRPPVSQAQPSIV